MKGKDWLLLGALRADGRASLRDLSRATGMKVSTLFDRLRSLVAEGIFQHTVVLDFDKIGLRCRAVVLLAVDKQQRDALASRLKSSNNVNSLFLINNGWNVLFEVVSTDMRECESFVDVLESEFNITKKEVHYVLGDVKRESFILDAK